MTKILVRLPFDIMTNIVPHCNCRTRNSSSFLSIGSCTWQFCCSTYIKTDQDHWDNWRELVCVFSFPTSKGDGLVT